MEKRIAVIPKEQIERQLAIIDEIKKLFEASGTCLLYYIMTFGCQQNEADSEKLEGMLCEMGGIAAETPETADIVLINTCAVREHAELRALGNAGSLIHSKQKKPGQIIVLCGCMTEQAGMAEKIKKSYRHVDVVFSPQSVWRFPELLKDTLFSRKRVFDTQTGDGEIFEGLPVKRAGGVKAWLSVMYGCNNFCSYCVVPYVRGRERSREADIILDDARALIKDGVRDITLLGQNVNSYGKDHDCGTDFAGILKSVCELDGEFLVRFMTSHPKDATERLFSTMAECKNAARQLHLPFQAGSDRILSEMNRGYTSGEYIKLIELARKYMPDITLTSDVIVGFPGETEGEFEETLRLIKQIRFDALFTFIYSKREGTKAALMPDPVTKEEKSLRFDKLLKLQNGISNERHTALTGQILRVLVESESKDKRYALTGRTEGGRLVSMDGKPENIGRFADVKIISNSSWSLYGEII